MGVGNPTELAGGISTALITTAAGISVAVPALIFHRYFKGRINDYVVRMEQQALKLVELSADVRQKMMSKPPIQTTPRQASVRKPMPQQARRTPQ